MRNLKGSWPVAFISSTFIDLALERRAVADALKSQNVLVSALDVAPVSTNSSKDKILRGIDESDFVILILGERYGSVLPSMTGGSEISITEWEYRQALMRGKSVLVFFMKWDEMARRNSDKFDSPTDPNFKQKQQRLARFKNEVTKRHSERYVSSAEELANAVCSALITTYRERLQEVLIERDKLKKELDDERLKNKDLFEKFNELIQTIQGTTNHTNNPGLRGGLLSTVALGSTGLRGGLADFQHNQPKELTYKDLLGSTSSIGLEDVAKSNSTLSENPPLPGLLSLLGGNNKK